MLDQVQGSPDVIFCNKTMRRKINPLMRAANQATEMVNDAFGRPIYSYAGIPIAVIEQDKDGARSCPSPNRILITATRATCTSIYGVRFGLAEYVSGLQAGSMDVLDQGLQGTFYQTLIEWIAGMGVFHPKAAARLRGIKNA